MGTGGDFVWYDPWNQEQIYEQRPVDNLAGVVIEDQEEEELINSYNSESYIEIEARREVRVQREEQNI